MPSAQRVHENRNIVTKINTLELTVGYSGYATLDTNWNNYMLSAPFNRLYLVETGGSDLMAGDQRLRMQPGKVYLLPAGLPCSYQCDHDMNKLFFHFNVFKPDRYDIFEGFGQIGELDLDPRTFHILLNAYQSNSFYDAILIRQHLYQLIAEFLQKYSILQTPALTYSHHVISTIRYIQNHLSAQLRVEDLADLLFVSKSYLSRCFRSEVGISLGRYIDEQLIRAAQSALSQTDESIASISARLEYCNQFYFSKAFKRITGISPQHYRKRMKY